MLLVCFFSSLMYLLVCLLGYLQSLSYWFVCMFISSFTYIPAFCLFILVTHLTTCSFACLLSPSLTYCLFACLSSWLTQPLVYLLELILRKLLAVFLHNPTLTHFEFSFGLHFFFLFITVCLLAFFFLSHSCTNLFVCLLSDFLLSFLFLLTFSLTCLLVCLLTYFLTYVPTCLFS